MMSELSPRDLRVSDAEREHTMRLLERATGRGFIDIHEFSERSAKVIAARTRADLNALLIDLPGLQLSGQPFQQPELTAGDRPPATRGDTLVLRGYGSRQFTGSWLVPSLIVVSGMGAATKLDFTQARLTSRVVTIEFQTNLGGAAHLRVPLGTVVRYDELDLRGCSLNNSLPATVGKPVLVLNLVGVKRYGSITIRPPKKGIRDVLNDLVG